MHWKALDKIDSNLYKGIAILMIVIHNFMHLFPSPKENEFAFSLEVTLNFIDLILTEPTSSFRILSSFFGHFGVQIFVFLSAYGLTKKFRLTSIQYWPFISQRMIKVYPAFILSIVGWMIIKGWIISDYGILGPLKLLYWGWEGVVSKILLISNFIPGQEFSPVGPWWFIPFIFQFYFIFPFILTAMHKWNGAILFIAVSSIILTVVLQGKLGDINLYFTVLAHMPELCLGIYLANRSEEKIQIPSTVILLSIFVFILGNFYELFWYVNHISFLIISLTALNYLLPFIKNIHTVKNILLFFGGISMELFLVNAFLREPFISWAMQSNSEFFTLILCFASLLSSIVVALLLSKSEKALMSKFNKRKSMA